MGRPREHDEETRAALRAAAERLVAEGGADALSVRAAAVAAGTTTRAVYSLFGSKEGLVAAVAQTAFEYLYDTIDRLPTTDDPAADLIAIGTRAVRRLALDHPGLFRIAFQRVAGLEAEPGLVAARQKAWVQLQGAVQRLQDAGLLGDKPVPDAAREINAMWEGLANAELRDEVLRIMPKGEEERAWQEALATVVRGFAAAPSPSPSPPSSLARRRARRRPAAGAG